LPSTSSLHFLSSLCHVVFLMETRGYKLVASVEYNDDRKWGTLVFVQSFA